MNVNISAMLVSVLRDDGALEARETPSKSCRTN